MLGSAALPCPALNLTSFALAANLAFNRTLLPSFRYSHNLFNACEWAIPFAAFNYDAHAPHDMRVLRRHRMHPATLCKRLYSIFVSLYASAPALDLSALSLGVIMLLDVGAPQCLRQRLQLPAWRLSARRHWSDCLQWPHT
jgi:hypothetical protein